MPRSLKIAFRTFFDSSGKSWLGGNEYIENLILAVGEVRKSENLPIEIHVIGRAELSPKVLSLVNEVYSNVPNMVEYAQRERLDFVYPYGGKGREVDGFASAAWIPDFQHKVYPEYFSKIELNKRDEEIEKTLKQSHRIILSSAAAERDCHYFYPNTVGKTRVLRFCTVPDREWYELDSQKYVTKYNLPKRYFLVSNQFWQHKNHKIILDALHVIGKTSLLPVVVFTGHTYDHRAPQYVDSLFTSINELNLWKQVRVLGVIPKLEQIQLLRGAVSVIQPSKFEGWNTMVENVKCFGKSIILSDIAVHVEQNPASCLYFETENSSDLWEKMEYLWNEVEGGVDKDKERIAYSMQQDVVTRVGREFLEIAGLYKVAK